jgi:hypothetical protein
MVFRIGRPSAASNGFDKNAHIEHLLIAVEPEAQEMETSYGPATAAHCSYVACVDCGTVDADVLLFGTALVPRLLDVEEGLVAGRLCQGQAKAGRQPPWLLEDPSDGDIAQAEAFLERCATRLPSGRIVMEPPRPDDPSKF